MVTPEDVVGPKRAPRLDGPSHRVDKAFEEGEKLPDFSAWLRSQQQEAAAAQERADEELLPLILAPHCRRRIDENKPLTQGDLAGTR
jgi:hypothetical protein